MSDFNIDTELSNLESFSEDFLDAMASNRWSWKQTIEIVDALTKKVSADYSETERLVLERAVTNHIATAAFRKNVNLQDVPVLAGSLVRHWEASDLSEVLKKAIDSENENSEYISNNEEKKVFLDALNAYGNVSHCYKELKNLRAQIPNLPNNGRSLDTERANKLLLGLACASALNALGNLLMTVPQMDR